MDEGVPSYSHNGNEPQGLSSSPLNLLIVEDVSEDIELILLTLDAADIPFTYDTTSSAEQCKHLLRTRNYDVVLSDYRLPDLNGLQVLELLKDLGQEIPFILITGSLGEEAAVECIKAGMTDYVLKDRLFRLPTVVERALQEFTLRRQQKSAIAQIHQQAWREAIVNRIVQVMRKTLVLEKVLQTTVDQIHEALHVNRCSILQPRLEQPSHSTISYISHRTTDREALLGVTCELYDSYQNALINDQPIIIHDTEDLPAHIELAAKTINVRSVLLMPLLHQQSYLGGICLQQCDRQRTWTEDEVVLIKAIADQCAIAIHQAQLYQQAQTELAERQRIEAQLRYDAFHDTLTGLPNRALLMNRLEHTLQLSQRRLIRYIPYQFAILFLDLDRFKVVNDSLGHTAGDCLLRNVAQQLQACLRMGDTVARLGGDEFVMLLEDIQGVHDAIEVANRIHQSLKAPISLNGHEVFISTSIGITLNSAHYTQPDQLLRDADIAMYRAKRRSRGAYEIFDASMHTHALRQLQLESDLQRAVERQELSVYYQPIMALDDRHIQGFETLLRWHHPEQGMIAPGEFIPIAEETGLIIDLDLWVVEEACRQLKIWNQIFPMLPALTVSVNLSGQQFSYPELISRIDQVLDGSGISGSQLKLEITEGVLIENTEVAATILRQFQDRNIQVCLDDFGTGYSSLSYLHRFPIDSIKIDQSFITLLETDLEKSEIVKAIVNLALNLGINVVAEGLETPKQLAYLRSIKCQSGQGYLFSPPLDLAAASEFLYQNNSVHSV
ncbi:EAL domain-containing protein [Vacuolonema iberomarrocanum]|uniref:EAL domain-containing protein n=1 Tax=Vacuolonema iberomarrocanum TaxID=3454632 RepID=UPI0019F8BDCF|nr:EAL domain-containing protein [filamentous cyanobacterium LEGE 07170]